MSTVAEAQAANVTPPRRSQTLVIATDATARAYDLWSVGFAGHAAPNTTAGRLFVYLSLQATGAACWYQLSDVSTATLDPSAAITAGSALAYVATHGAFVADGSEKMIRINRNVDRYLIIRTASGTGKLVIYASSEEVGG